MKKLICVFSLVLGLSFAASAQNDGGLFQRGNAPEERAGGFAGPGLPGHGETGNQPAPLGSGALLLIGFGAAYALSKKKNN